MNQNQHNYNNDDIQIEDLRNEVLDLDHDDLSDHYDAIDDDGDHEYYQITYYDDWQTHNSDYGDYYGITEEDGDDHEYYDDEYAEHVVNNLAPELEIFIDFDGEIMFVDPDDEDLDEGFCEDPEINLSNNIPQLEKYIEISIRHYMNKYTGYKQPYIDDIFKAFDKYINGRFFSKPSISWRREVILELNDGHVDVVYYVYKYLSNDRRYYLFNYIDIEQILSDALHISIEEEQE